MGDKGRKDQDKKLKQKATKQAKIDKKKKEQNDKSSYTISTTN